MKIIVFFSKFFKKVVKMLRVKINFFKNSNKNVMSFKMLGRNCIVQRSKHRSKMAILKRPGVLFIVVPS